MTNSTWRLVVAIAALLTVGTAGFALGAGLASEPVSVPTPATVATVASTAPVVSVPMPTDPSSTGGNGQVATSPPSSTGASAAADVAAATTASAAGSQPATDLTEIAISNFAFTPGDISVAAGTTVVFVNEDEAVHNVLSEDGQLQAPDLNHGDTYEVTLDQPGAIAYICNIHQFMNATITVTA